MGLDCQSVAVVANGSVDLPHLVEGESSVENCLEVTGVQLNGLVVALYRFLEIELLPGLPPIAVVHVSLSQHVFFRPLRPADITH